MRSSLFRDGYRRDDFVERQSVLEVSRTEPRPGTRVAAKHGAAAENLPGFRTMISDMAQRFILGLGTR